MIEVSKLTKRFDDFTAVDEVSFTVDKGETLILLGPSGCGKTTTLKMINLLIEPSAGTVRIAGTDVRKRRARELRKHIGYVIQNVGLFPHYTVAQNIATVPKLLKWDRQKIRDRSRELLEMLDMPPDEFLQRYPQELSGGQQQRVGLARALAADPPVILLDEPFGALDPLTRVQIQKEFKKLETIITKTLVMVTHDVFEAVELGDRICLLKKGQVQQFGTPKELLFSPANPFVTEFFEANRFQLELKVMTLEDIVPELERRETAGGEIHEFREDTNLLHVLETMDRSAARDLTLRVTDADDRPIVDTTLDRAMAAFYRQKARMGQSQGA